MSSASDKFNDGYSSIMLKRFKSASQSKHKSYQPHTRASTRFSTFPNFSDTKTADETAGSKFMQMRGFKM